MRWVGAYVGAMTCLAANAQGMVLTLSAVEMITSFAVPLSCIFAYNTPINGCEVGDFTSGQCSSNCQRALQRVETNIRASCDTVDAQPNSLIWEAQRGNLHVLGDAFIHSYDVDDYTDVYRDDDTDNDTNDTNNSELDADRFKLAYRDRVADGHGSKLHGVDFFTRDHLRY